MQDPIDIFLDESATASEREALRRAIASDDGLRAAVEAWVRSDEAVRRRWDEMMPDRRLLVLWALERDGRAAELTADEQQLLRETRADIEAAHEQLVALDDVADDVASCCAEFDRLWTRRAKPDRKAPDRSRLAPRGSRRNARWIWRVPVAVAVVAFMAVAVLLFDRDMLDGSDAFELVATGSGETRIISMEDGTTIRLMPDSRLSYVPLDRQSPVNRRARLEGRAYFDVAQRQTGLLVETPTATATVLGTSFGVEAMVNETKVALVEGRLALAGNIDRGRAVVLEPGQLSRVSADGLPSEPEAVNLAEYLEWTGMFIFRSEAVAAVAENLSRHFNVAISVDAALSGERITGTFEQTETLESILGVVAAALDATVERSDTGFRLRTRP